jgi:hypothetical protein
MGTRARVQRIRLLKETLPAGAGHAADEAPAPDATAGGRLRATIGRLPAALRRRLTGWRLTRWRLAVLGAVLLVLIAWGAVAVSSTTMYSSTVLFTEAGSGIGIPPPFENLDFGDVSQGMPMHRNVILENNGKLDTYVMVFSWGGIRDFLSIDDAFFNIAPGEQHTVDFSVQAPSNANLKRYSGRVFVVRLPWYWPF